MSNSTEDTFDFQAFLQSDELAELRDYQKVESIIYSVSASISVIGSAATISHILRSHKGLSSTYHRLVFGLCVGDLMASFAWAFNSFFSAERDAICHAICAWKYGNVHCSGIHSYGWCRDVIILQLFDMFLLPLDHNV